MASASDVPNKYDCVINGTGYLFYDQIEESLPFRVSKAIYGYSPTFVERQNVQGSYGDNQQDFWLTASQNDWSLGEQQRFFKAQDQDGQRKYWRGTWVDVSIPGQVSERYSRTSTSSAFGSTVLTSAVALPAAAAASKADTFYGTTSTNLWNANTDKGAHGLGASPTTIVSDGTDIYMSTETAGTVGVRKYDFAVFSTFSATGVTRLAFLNNTLYGLKVTSSAVEFGRFDTAGVYTAIFPWKASDGGALGGFATGQLCPFGGKMAILLAGADGAELWVYDGVGTSLLAKFPPNLVGGNGATTGVPMQLQVAEGILFVSGGIVVQQEVGATTKAKWKPSIWFYVNGNIGELWRASGTITGATNGVAPDAPLMAPFQDGLAFLDDDSGQVRFYSPATGGVSSIATPTDTTHNNSRFFSGMRTKLVYVTGTTYDVLPDSSAGAENATVTSSLFDFDSSVDKLFRGIKVNFDSATDGNGGHVDIAYRVGDVDGSYTTLQASATSGTEYTLSGVSGPSISVKVTLNKSTSTNGPVLKRVYVRAVPVLQQFPMRQYVLACFGDATTDTQTLRDGSPNPKAGRDLANDLITAVTSATPISITDRFGTYTAILEPANFELHEIHANPLVPPASSGSFIARVSARGV